MNISKMYDAVKAWWGGKWEPYENEPGSGVVFIGGVQTYHWTAKVARAVWRFFATEWKWIIGAMIAVAGVWTAYLRLP